MKPKHLLLPLLRFLLPLALLLAQHGIWAHGFGHDAAKMAAHGLVPDHASHTCCLPYETAADATCGAQASAQGQIAVPPAAATPTGGRAPATALPYCSHAPPLTS